METVEITVEGVDVQVQGVYYPKDDITGQTEDFEIFEVLHCGKSIWNVLDGNVEWNITCKCIEHLKEK